MLSRVRVRSVASSAAAITIGLVLTLAGLSIVGAAPDFGLGGSSSGGQFDASRLLTSGRDRLAICVDSANLGPPMETPAESLGQKSIQLALDELAASDQTWAKKGLSEPSPVVDVGCPAPPSVYDPTAGPLVDDALFEVRGRRVDAASYYRIFVFVLPDEDIQRYAQGGTYRLTTEEYQCEFDNCGEVTTGIYVSRSDLSNGTLVRANLARAIGLE